MKKFFLTIALFAALTGCGEKNTGTANVGAGNTGPANNGAPSPAASASPTIDPSYQATFPFKDFPAVGTTAKAGEAVLVPSYLWLQQANVNGAEQTSMIWYQATMGAPGGEMSEVQYAAEKRKVPNAYIIPIPARQTARTGDILLTWWQSGSGMQRAIVVDDADPAAPVVRYLDLEYDNPAKAKDGKTSIGQMEEKLAPDTFVKINAPLAPGTSVAIEDNGKQKFAQVIRSEGDRIFVREFAGRTSVREKSRCTPVPVESAAATGDAVKALWSGSFETGRVTRVDPRIGRVFVRFDIDGKERAVAFGNVLK